MISSGGGGALESFNYLVDIPWGSRSLVLVYGGEDCGEGGGHVFATVRRGDGELE